MGILLNVVFIPAIGPQLALALVAAQTIARIATIVSTIFLEQSFAVTPARTLCIPICFIAILLFFDLV
jgi:hypothetical protein